MAHMETPHMNTGHFTPSTNLREPADFIASDSFVSPVKKSDDLILQRHGHPGASLKTPNFRAPLSNRPNFPQGNGRTEFTPLLKSPAKNNLVRAGKENAVSRTPAALRRHFQINDSPGLQRQEDSLYDDNSRTSLDAQDQATPIPLLPMSSTQVTPSAISSKRDKDGVLPDTANSLTLKEQENIIDKIEKENFGLKLKIHFLERNLGELAPESHQVALKENANLKVDKMTMQQELKKARIALNRAERQLENVKHEHASQGLQDELKRYQHELKVAHAETVELRQKSKAAENKLEDVEDKLAGQIEDLEADLREKNLALEQVDDELEMAKGDKDQVQELNATIEELRIENNNCKEEAKEIEARYSIALSEKKKAQDDLDELHDEMANKSFTTKGLTRQTEEKAEKLEDDLHQLHDRHDDLQTRFDDQSSEIQRLREAMKNAREDAVSREASLHDSLETIRREHEGVLRDRSSMKTDLRNNVEQKGLLQSWHDALTAESQSLQHDLANQKEIVAELEKKLEDDRCAAQDEQVQRNEAEEEKDRLLVKIERLRQKLEDERRQFVAKEEDWATQRKDLTSQKEGAEHKANGLSQTVKDLRAIEGTLSGHDIKFQEALENERLQHQDNENILSEQIKHLRVDIQEKQRRLEESRAESTQLREELSISERHLRESNQRVQNLEDEIDVLQDGLSQELDKARGDEIAAKREAENLRGDLSITKQKLSHIEGLYNAARANIDSHQGDANPQEHLGERILNLEDQLLRLESEKLTLQDELAQAHHDLRSVRASTISTDAELGQLRILRQNLSLSQQKENNLIQQMSTQKETIGDLKRGIADLEQQIHDVEVSKLAVDSGNSMITSSVRKTELVEIRRQLDEAHQQIRDLRTKSKENERGRRYRTTALDKAAREQSENFEEERVRLEKQIANLEQVRDEQKIKAETAEKTTIRLESRVRLLELDLRAARLERMDNLTMAEERKDLHEMLKEAKLEAEDLQVAILDREARIQSAATREKDLRLQTRRAFKEKTIQTQRATAMATELDNLQWRYESKVEEIAQQQKKWEEEHNAMMSRVRFPNMSVSSIHAGKNDASGLKQLQREFLEKEKRHQQELKGLAKQIQWLRAKLRRTEGFRVGLAYEKKYLSLNIEMLEACNKVDLHILEDMGVAPGKLVSKKPPSLRVVGYMALAGIRMRKLSQEWAIQKKLRTSLVKGAEQMRKSSRKATIAA